MLMLVGSILTAIAVAGASFAGLRWYQGAEARSDRREKQRELTQKAVEASQAAAEEARRKQVERVNADPAGAMLQPALSSIASVWMPLLAQGEHASRALRGARQEVTAAQERVRSEAAKVPGWLNRPGVEKIAKYLAIAAPILLVLHFIFDYSVFSSLNDWQMAVVYALMSTGGLVFCTVALYVIANQLLNPTRLLTRVQRGVWALALVGAMAATMFTFLWLYGVADARSSGHSREAIATAQREIDQLEVKKANGDPLFTDAKLNRALANLEAAKDAKVNAAQNDRVVSMVFGGVEMFVVLAEAIYIAYYSPLSPRRRAEHELSAAQARVSASEAQLLTVNQHQRLAAAQFVTDLVNHYGGDSDYSIPNIEQAINEATARAINQSHLTYNIVVPEQARPSELKSVLGSTGADEAHELTDVQPAPGTFPPGSTADTKSTPAPEVVQERNPAAPAAPTIAFDPPATRNPAQNSAPRVFGNHNFDLDDLDEF